jgi:hypothetical protein
MEADLKIIKLEKDILKLLGDSNVTPTVLQLVLMKIQNNISVQINSALNQYQQQMIMQQKQKQEQENNHIINSEEENKEGV